MSYHTPRNPTLAIIIKLEGLISMTGSFLILRDIYHRKFSDKRDISQQTTILLLELSVCDLASSFFGPFVGSWMFPKESGAFLAAGSMASCTAQGFLTRAFYSASVLLNTALAVTYCLVVKKGVKDSHSNSAIANWVPRVLPALGVLGSVGPLLDDAYNFSGTACEISSYPLGCGSPGSETQCTRGSNAFVFLMYELAVLIVANVIIVGSVSLLIHSVFVLERKMDGYSPDGYTANRTNTLKTTWQGIWYIAAFTLAWWPFATFHFVGSLSGDVPPSLLTIYSITFPMQGAYNAIVYFRPRYNSDRERHNCDSKLTSFLRVLRLSLSCPSRASPHHTDDEIYP